MFLSPQKIFEQLDLRDDMVAAEFGCGSGGFAIPLAKRLDEGLVYAVDVQPEPLSALKSLARLNNLKNIRIIRSDLEKEKGSGISPDSLNLAVIPNLLFQAENIDAIISEAMRVLKTGGILALIDWRPESSRGPEKRVSKAEAKSAAEENGFSFVKELDAGKYHYCLIFRK